MPCPNERCIILTIGILALFSTAATAMDAAETRKTEWLINRVAALEEAVFIRNGDSHSPREAADHLRYKWEKAGSRVNTAEEFVEKVASRSYLSGRPYLIRFPDGRTEPTAEVFKRWLSAYDAAE